MGGTWYSMVMLRVAITTLGCKVNRADADALMAHLADFAVEVPFSGQADLYIVNSCTVTSTADRQSRQMLNRARRREPAARVVLTGCMAARGGSALEVDGVFPHMQHADLVQYARRLDQELGAPEAEAEGTSRAQRSRPFLKIQDGCDSTCTYCVVSRVRGPSRSIPPGDVSQGLRRLAHLGYQEVVITGIHLGQYGRDLDPPTSLAEVVTRNLGIVSRVRLSSVEPMEVDGLLAGLVCDTDGVCPHLHVPIQSGDDGVLRAMNRPYTGDQVRDLLQDMRRRCSHLALGADLMTGFPGESEAQFEATLRLVQESPLTHLHVFPYSPRAGTKAATMPSQIPGPVARARAARLRDAGVRKLSGFAATQAGRVCHALVERADDGRLSALTDNYLRISVEGAADLVGSLVLVKVLSSEGPVLRGRACTKINARQRGRRGARRARREEGE